LQRLPIILFIALLLILPVAVQAEKWEAVAALGSPVPERLDGREGSVDFVHWVGDSIVCAGRSGFARRFDPETRRELWSAKLKGDAQCRSFAGSKDRLYLIDDGGGVHVFRCADGVEIETRTQQQFSDLLGTDFVIPYRVTWVPVAEKLLVFTSAAKVGTGLLLDGTTFAKAATIKTGDFVRFVSTDATGRFAITVTDKDNIQIWDLQAAQEIFKCDQNETPAVDAEFTSNVQFDGDRTLVYTVDNSWSTGTVVVHDILANQEKARFNSRNGHVVMDVDFVHQRIALTGTERRLTILGLAGNVIADKESVTFQRNVAIAFSPDGSKLAIGSWDNTVRIFGISKK
jgi:WD domain, G-beta repeat